MPPSQTTVEDVSPRLPKSLSLVIWILLAFMALCIARAIVSQNMNYIDLQKYAHLQEASPFQERILMAFVLRAADGSHAVLRVYDALFHKTVDTPEDFAVMVVDCVCLLLMLPVTVALRRCFQPPPRTTWLAPLMMLLVVAFTYVVHYEQRFTMPYDQLSLLLYSVGLLAILRRNGWLLLLVLAVATPNRETVVFLIPVWFWLEWREGRRMSAMAFSVAGLAVWMGVAARDHPLPPLRTPALRSSLAQQFGFNLCAGALAAGGRYIRLPRGPHVDASPLRERSAPQRSLACHRAFYHRGAARRRVA